MIEQDMANDMCSRLANEKGLNEIAHRAGASIRKAVAPAIVASTIAAGAYHHLSGPTSERPAIVKGESKRAGSNGMNPGFSVKKPGSGKAGYHSQASGQLRGLGGAERSAGTSKQGNRIFHGQLPTRGSSKGPGQGYSKGLSDQELANNFCSRLSGEKSIGSIVRKIGQAGRSFAHGFMGTESNQSHRLRAYAEQARNPSSPSAGPSRNPTAGQPKTTTEMQHPTQLYTSKLQQKRSSHTKIAPKGQAKRQASLKPMKGAKS